MPGHRRRLLDSRSELDSRTAGDRHRSDGRAGQTGGVNRYIAAIDQGTTSSRCIVFDPDGAIVALDQREHRQLYPRPGWVEHDPLEIWHNVQAVTRGALDRAGLSRAD